MPLLLAAALLAPPAPAVVDRAPSAPAHAPAHADTTLLADLELGARLVGHGLTAPLRWSTEQWLTLPAAAAVLTVVSVADDEVERFAETHQGTFGDAYFGTLEPFGEHYSIALVLGVYVGGVALDRPGWRRTAVEAAASSVVAAGIVTPTLKLVIGRVRPREELGPYRFDPFSGHYSFPSGHTTQAFAVASVIAAESESWVVDALAYGVATTVAGARIYHDAHFLTDVLAGAAIGTVVGQTMVRQGRELRGTVEPFVGRATGGWRVGLRVPVR